MRETGMLQLIASIALMGFWQAGWTNMVTYAETPPSYIDSSNVTLNRNPPREIFGRPGLATATTSTGLETYPLARNTTNWQHDVSGHRDASTEWQVIARLATPHRDLTFTGDDVQYHMDRNHDVTHTYVPLPSVAWLFVTGLILLLVTACGRSQYRPRPIFCLQAGSGKY